MKLHMVGVYSLIGLLAVTNSGFADHSNAIEVKSAATGNVYAGIFGGGGSSNKFNIDQYGTAFFTEASGGPLAVNAFGQAKNNSAAFFGAQLGYQTPGLSLNLNSQWSLLPAVEIEGLYINKRSLSSILSNNTERLDEHEFSVTYPMRRNVFLLNTVLNLNQTCFLVRPYIGFGIGGATARISGADATQLAPAEININHYNSNTHDTDTTFAGQLKVGLSYDITNAINVFAEYRWLYFGSTHFTFGSTVYPAHAPTSSWQVKLDPQKYNLGSIGIRVNL